MENLTKENVTKLSKKLNQLISEEAAKLGLKFTGLGNIKYDNKSFKTGTLEFALQSSQKDFDKLSDYIGHKWKHKRRIFTVKSVEGNKLVATTQNGKNYLIRPEQFDNMILLS